MTVTQVIHVKDSKPGDVYIGRAGKGQDGYFGNPYRLTDESRRAEVIAKYAQHFQERLRDPEFKRRVLELKGKRLVCFCAPKPCHGDVIAAWLNSLEWPEWP